MDMFHVGALAILFVGLLAILWMVASGRKGAAPAGNIFAGATKTIEGALGHLGKPSTIGSLIDTVEQLRSLLAERGVVTAEVTSAIEVIELAVLHAKPAAAPAQPISTGA